MAFNLLLALIFIFIITLEKPIFYQWLLLVLMIDPTGHISKYFNKDIMGGVEANDIFYVLIFFTFFIVSNYSIVEFFKNKTASGIFKVLFVFFVYRIIVYGYLVPPVSGLQEYFRYFLVRERGILLAFFIIIPVYLIALKNLKTYFYLIVTLGSLAVILFPVSVLSGVNITPSYTMLRYHEESILRQFIYNYSVPLLLISLSIIVYLSKIRVKYKKLLLGGGIFSIFAILVSLTKGLYLSMFGVIMGSVYLTVKPLKIPIRKGITRSIVLVFATILILSIFMPSYIGFSSRMLSELYSLGTTGRYESGKQEGRMETVVPAQLYMIKQRPLFGTGPYGYKKNNLSDKFDYSAYDATDVSITGTIMLYGIFGMFIYYIFYYRLYLVCKRIYLLLKRKNRIELINKYKYEFIFSISSISFFIGGLLRVHNITSELVSGSILFYTNVGILLACLERIKRGIFIETQQAKTVNSKSSLIKKQSD